MVITDKFDDGIYESICRLVINIVTLKQIGDRCIRNNSNILYRSNEVFHDIVLELLIQFVFTNKLIDLISISLAYIGSIFDTNRTISHCIRRNDIILNRCDNFVNLRNAAFNNLVVFQGLSELCILCSDKFLHRVKHILIIYNFI